MNRQIDKMTGRYLKTSVDLERVCECGTEFTTTDIRLASGRGLYCGRDCSNKHRGVTGDKHPKWKDASVLHYTTIHQWVYRQLGKPSYCVDCGTHTAKRFEWANISGEYRRDLKDWKRLCSSCHHKLDDIAARGWRTRRAVA